MGKIVPLYEPPVADDIAQLRTETLHGVDQEMFVHVGHFVSWFGAVDMLLSMTLHYYSGSIRPPEFDVLTRGLDAKTKLHRLGQAMELAEWTMEPGLKKRLDHFQKIHIPLRNKLVHSYLYWPADGSLQVCGVGNPPIFADVRFEAADPFQITGLTLFERGAWLSQLCHDMTVAFNGLTRPMPKGGVLGTGNYLSGLPSGGTPGTPK
jgi:hypothetical protein